MRKTIILMFLMTACTDAGNTQIEIPFDLLASDELSTSATGICTITPVTQAGGPYKSSGLLEINPVLNPGAEYVLNLQVENYLSTQTVTDSSGNVLVNSNDNDFHMQKAIVKYLDIEGNLMGLPDNAGVGVASDVALISGVVRTGGAQAATAVSVPAITANEVVPMVQSFLNNTNLGPNAIENVVLEVQVFGVLGSGEVASSGLFYFPLEVCFGCDGIPLQQIDAGPALGQPFLPVCPNGTSTSPISIGHGPCCAAQDFFLTCLPAGGSGGPCYRGQDGTSSPSCQGTLTCTGSPPEGVITCDTIPFEFVESVTCATAS